MIKYIKNIFYDIKILMDLIIHAIETIIGYF